MKLQGGREGGQPSLDPCPRAIATEKPAHRRRHELWHRASEVVSKIDLFWHENERVKVDVVKLFQDYCQDVRDKVLVLVNEKDEGIILPYKTRADADYIREVRRKLRPLKKIRSDRAIMMTLTTDPSRWTSLAQAYHALLPNFHRLMTWLVNKYGSPLQYLVVPEFTKKGVPHLHVVFLGVSYLVSQKDLSDAWSRYGQGKIVDLRRCGQGFRNSSVFHYVMKYVEKAWDIRGEDPSNLYHIACLWALNGRSFNCSRDLLTYKARVKMGFVYLGSFAYDLILEFVGKAIEFGERVLFDRDRLRGLMGSWYG